MEKMVTDPTIKKVILVCDQAYAAKTDGRAGGVGTEAQIISAEVYAKQSQEKFVAVIAEKDSTGKPFLPTYYKSRIYVDLSESDRYSENFEKLLRWIFGKPLNVRPEIGKPPSFVVDSDAPVTGTSAIAKRAIEGFRNDKGYTRGTLDEYLTLFSENLERFRITGKEGHPDDRIVKSIDDFISSRNELIQVMTSLIQYSDPFVFAPRIHKFLESLIPYLFHPPHVTQWSDIDFDNFKFIVHEIFLYVVALMLRVESLVTATYLLEHPYFVEENSKEGRNPTVSFTVFRQPMKSLKIRNERLGTRRVSLRADMLEQRSKILGIPFRFIMQADFVCFLRADLSQSNGYDRWWPETLPYADRFHGSFEIFARSTSNSYLLRTLPVLGVSSLSAIKAKLDEYAAGTSNVPRWEFETLNPAALLGFDHLGTIP